MRIDRPKITVPYEPLDIAIEIVNISLLLFLWLYPVMVYGELGDTIPTHLNAQGEADDFGSKSTIWILPAIGTGLFILMFVLNRYPHLHNYMVNITEENALSNYRISTRVLRIANLFCMILFGVIILEIIGIARNNPFGLLGTGFLIVTITLPLVGLGIAFYYYNKVNKNS